LEGGIEVSEFCPGFGVSHEDLEVLIEQLHCPLEIARRLSHRHLALHGKLYQTHINTILWARGREKRESGGSEGGGRERKG